MTDICKCCGQTLPPNPPLGCKLRGKQARIVELVFRAGPHGIKSDQLFELLHENDPNGGPETGIKVLHVQVNQVNKKLKPYGHKIKATSRGEGGPCEYVLVEIRS